MVIEVVKNSKLNIAIGILNQYIQIMHYSTSVDHVIAVAAKVKTEQDKPLIYAAVNCYYEDILNLTYISL